VTFFKGHFSGSGKEKGIDVHLAVDLALGAATNAYDQAAIMTGDADLLYAVECAKQFQKAVHLVAFGSRFPLAISFQTKKKIVFDYHRFFVRSVAPRLRGRPKGLTVRDLRGRLKVRHV